MPYNNTAVYLRKITKNLNTTTLFSPKFNQPPSIFAFASQKKDPETSRCSLMPPGNVYFTILIAKDNVLHLGNVFEVAGNLLIAQVIVLEVTVDEAVVSRHVDESVT